MTTMQELLSKFPAKAGKTLKEAIEFAHELLKLDNNYPMKNTQRLIDKCLAHSRSSQRLAELEKQEANNILFADETCRVCYSYFLAAVCGALTGGMSNMAAGSAFFRAGVTTSVGQRLICNAISQLLVQGSNALMSKGVTGTASFNLGLLLFNGVCAGVSRGSYFYKSSVHVLRMYIVAKCNETPKKGSLTNYNYQQLATMVAEMPRQDVVAELPEAKDFCMEQIISAGEQSCTDIYNGTINKKEFERIRNIALKQIAEDIPQLHWFSELTTMGSSQKGLERSLVQCAKHLTEANHWGVLGAILTVQKIRCQRMANSAHTASADRLRSS